MNTSETTSEGSEKFEGDKLDRIFGGQKDLMQRYKGISEEHFRKIFGSEVKIDDSVWEGGESNIHTKAGNFFIKDMIDATIHELSEAVQTLKNWKSWKQTEMPADAAHFKEELIDALHFFVEALILSGVTPQEAHDIYFKKREVNKFRQESKY